MDSLENDKWMSVVDLIMTDIHHMRQIVPFLYYINGKVGEGADSNDQPLKHNQITILLFIKLYILYTSAYYEFLLYNSKMSNAACSAA